MSPDQTAELLSLTALQAWSTAVAVVVSAGSVVAITIQIFLTRKSVKQSELSVAQSAASVEATRQALADSQRGRIDQEMPRLTLTVSKEAGAVLGWAITNPNGGWGEPVSLSDPARPFVLPRDNSVLICTRALVVITNSGPRPARIEIRTNWEYGQKTRTADIAVGQTKKLPIDRVLSVSQWAEYALFAVKQSGLRADDPAPRQPDGNPMETLDTEIAKITYTFPGDTGAIETHRISQTGTILDADQSNNSGWVIKNPARSPAWAIETTIHPFEREYFASFKEGRRL